jgi:hypothetical protein
VGGSNIAYLASASLVGTVQNLGKLAEVVVVCRYRKEYGVLCMYYGKRYSTNWLGTSIP